MKSRIKELIDKKFKTRRALAQGLGISEQQMSPWLNGSSKPSAEILEKMAALGINVQWLLTGEGEMEIKPASEEIKTLRAENERLRQTVKAVVQSVSEFSGMKEFKENGDGK